MPAKKSFAKTELFTINFCHESIYLLGLLWADGWLSTIKRHHTISIEMLESDISSISEIFDITGNWLTYRRKRQNTNNYMIRRYLSEIDLWNFLSKNGYHDKSGKSACDILNKIPHNLQYLWWRGYFDGDGTVGKCQRSRILSFCSGYNQDWLFVENLKNIIDIKFKYLTGQYKNGRHSKMYVGTKRDISIFFDYIYPNGYDFGLKRKYDKFIYTLLPCDINAFPLINFHS